MNILWRQSGWRKPSGKRSAKVCSAAASWTATSISESISAWAQAHSCAARKRRSCSRSWDAAGSPYPARLIRQTGDLWGGPTLINNVETFGNITCIILKGADYYASFGTEKTKGAKIFALAGKVNNTGLIEVPIGITLREIVYDIGGGIPGGRPFKAAQTGGPSGGCIPAEYLDVPIDYETLQKLGSIMGSGGLIVMDDQSCMPDVAKFFMEFCMDESCGKCGPCRGGTVQMHRILTKITNGSATMEDLTKLEELCLMVKETSLCGLGNTCPNPIYSTLRYFRDEYEAHIKDHHCPAGVCQFTEKPLRIAVA